MRRWLGINLAIVLAVAVPALGWAQDEDGEDEETAVDDEMTEEGGGEAAPDATAAPAPTATEGTAVSETSGVGPYTKAGYPLEYVNRPLTLVKGMIEVRGGLGYGKLNLNLGALGNFSASSLSLRAGAGYGIMDKLEAGAYTTLFSYVKPEGAESDSQVWGKDLDLYGAYGVLDTEKLDLAAVLSIPLDFEEDADVLPYIGLGANTRFIAIENLAVLAGHNLITVGIADGMDTRANINVGVGYQIMPALWAQLDTQLVSLKLAGDGETTSLGDFIPINLMALYALSNKLDAMLQVSLPSVEDAGDLWAIGLGANFRL